MVGSAVSAIWLVRQDTMVQHRLAILMAAAWAIQAISGILFGATTLFFDGQLPDIHGIAVDALLIKIFCALVGFVLAAIYVRLNAGWPANKRFISWGMLLSLGVAALSSAAFLRWFS